MATNANSGNGPEGEYDNTEAPGTDIPTGKPHARIDVSPDEEI